MSRTPDPAVAVGPPRAPGAGGGATVVCIGVFDGVHAGHRWLLSRGRAAADRLGLPLTVLTFDPHPLRVVRPGFAPCALATVEHRVRLLAESGADAVRILTFDRAASLLSPTDFVREYLRDDLAARHVVIGRNFRFGHRAAGDAALLSELGREAGFDVEPVDLHADPDGTVWSSSRIRDLLAGGDVEGAARGLQRLHRVEGPVEPGDRRGRELGFPTANVDVAHGACRPADGVYAGDLVLDPFATDPTRLPAAISVGANRTFDGVDARVEAYALDRDDLDLYGRIVAVDFKQRLRDMIAFDSVGSLVAAMNRDVARARIIASG
jgi:riboflavin kinase/FMN adenylyltransferase